MGEKNESPSAQKDRGISKRLEWDEKNIGESEVITDHNHDCIFRCCKKCGAINTLQESIIKQNSDVDWRKQVMWHQWQYIICLLYTSPSPRDATLSRMPSSA